jgi:ElaA protein
MSLELYKKKFEELTLEELYQIIDLRLEVFVCEQNIIYKDTDDKDYKCLHYFYKDTDTQKVVAYMRILPKGLRYDEYCFGRLCVNKNYRGARLSTSLFYNAQKDLDDDIRISGQAYLKDYYMSLGFSIIKGPYIEEDISHYEMLLKKGCLVNLVNEKKVKLNR